MKKVLLLSAIIALSSCKKEEVKPVYKDECEKLKWEYNLAYDDCLRAYHLLTADTTAARQKRDAAFARFKASGCKY